MTPEHSGGDVPTVSPRRPIDLSKIAYQLPRPMGMVPAVSVAGAVMLDGDGRNWVPQSPTVQFKPLLLNVSQGYHINILRVLASGVLSRHRHYGPVHAFTLRGTWHHLERDWVASIGDYALEPAGETQTLVVPDNVPEMTTLFRVTGGSPAWGTKPFIKQDRAGLLVVLASGYDSDVHALPLRAETTVLGATLIQDQAAEYEVGEHRYLYLMPAVGRPLVNGLQIDARVGAAIKGVRRLIITAVKDSEFVLVDAPEGRSVLSSTAA